MRRKGRDPREIQFTERMRDDGVRIVTARPAGTEPPTQRPWFEVVALILLVLTLIAVYVALR